MRLVVCEQWSSNQDVTENIKYGENWTLPSSWLYKNPFGTDVYREICTVKTMVCKFILFFKYDRQSLEGDPSKWRLQNIAVEDAKNMQKWQEYPIQLCSFTSASRHDKGQCKMGSKNAYTATKTTLHVHVFLRFYSDIMNRVLGWIVTGEREYTPTCSGIRDIQ